MTKPRSFAPIIAAVLLLLPVLYVGSYLALVTPRSRFVFEYGDYCYYRISSKSLRTLYWPLEQIDRRARPRAWWPLSVELSNGIDFEYTVPAQGDALPP